MDDDTKYVTCEHVEIEVIVTKDAPDYSVTHETRCTARAIRQQFSIPAPFQFGEGKKGSPVGEAVKRVKAKGL